MIRFTFESTEQKLEGVLSMFATLAGMTQQEVVNAINEGIASGGGQLTIHGPRGTVQTDLSYARTLVGR
jgi:hypothetical protein